MPAGDRRKSRTPACTIFSTVDADGGEICRRPRGATASLERLKAWVEAYQVEGLER
jgi:hypothetical protein